MIEKAEIDWFIAAAKNGEEIIRLREEMQRLYILLSDAKAYFARRGMLSDDGDAAELYETIREAIKEWEQEVVE